MPASGASRKKASNPHAQFQRLRLRHGSKKAICAVAASILTAAHHMLRDGTFYQDLGADYFHRLSPQARANRLARQITELGLSERRSPAPGRASALAVLGDAFSHALQGVCTQGSQSRHNACKRLQQCCFTVQETATEHDMGVCSAARRGPLNTGLELLYSSIDNIRRSIVER